jgi:hypothetical protein
MREIVRITESEVNRIIRRILNERDPGDGQNDDFTDLIAQFGKSGDDISGQQNLAEYDEEGYSHSRKGINEMDDIYLRIKSCYDKTNAIRVGKGQKKFPYPTLCEKGLTGEMTKEIGCLGKLHNDISYDHGDNRLKGSLGPCLGKLSPIIKKGIEGMG